MRKSFKYISLIGIVGLLASCVSDARFDGAGQDGDGLWLRMSLSIPEMQANQTRAGGVLDDPAKNPHNLTADFVNDLKFYMFIFEDAGSPEGNYLRTLVHDDDITPVNDDGSYAGNDPDHLGQILYSYNAKVDGTSENAIIHLVATADPDFETQLQNSIDRSELGLFYGANGLCTSGQHPAFWKRIDLGMPINSDNKETIEEKLRHVNMIRNFCRVTVSTSTDKSNLNGFEVMGFTLVNQVDHGYVAAYSENDPRGFVEFEATGDDGELNRQMKSYADIFTVDKYIPARHPLSKRAHKEEEHDDWLSDDNNANNDIFTMDAKYMFERPYQSQHRTFVLVKGCFKGNTEAPRYIKFDIGDIPDWDIDDNGFYKSSAFEYRHLYRNFSYNIVIQTVASTDVGASKASAAVLGYATNNVGASVEVQSIKDISDGIDRMWVNKTKFVIVDTDEGTPNPKDFDLKWRYVEKWKSTKTNVSQYIKWDYPGMELKSNDESGIFGDVDFNKTYDDDDNDGFGQWRGASIKFNTPDETVRQKTVRLYYSSPSSNRPNVKLSRDVTFVLRKRWEFVYKPAYEESDPKYNLDVEVYPGAYSFDENSPTPQYETLEEMRKNHKPGYVSSAPGQDLTVMFELPEGLPEAIFPLDFIIGANRQNIENAYVGNAPVITGPSLFEGWEHGDGSSTRLQYVKTVTWDYYNGTGDAGSKGHRLVCVRFLTTNYASTEINDESQSDDGKTTSVTRIRVKNDYFMSKGKKDASGRVYGEGRFERIK